MTPSSEEIATALEDGIRACGVLSKADPEANIWSESAATLRSHLSRLREEAEFRDAARKVGRNADLYGWGWPGEQTEIWKDAAVFVDAYRALEEPTADAVRILHRRYGEPSQEARDEDAKERALEEPRDG